MRVYLGDESQPYNVFHFTESRKRDGPLEFLRDYNQVLVADAYGGYDGVVAANAMVPPCERPDVPRGDVVGQRNSVGVESQ